jgi:hypothetical protein
MKKILNRIALEFAEKETISFRHTLWASWTLIVSAAVVFVGTWFILAVFSVWSISIFEPTLIEAGITLMDITRHQGVVLVITTMIFGIGTAGVKMTGSKIVFKRHGD